MPLEIKPEPTPEEREAIMRALAEQDGAAEPAAWWRAGVREAVDGAPDEADLD